MSPPSTPKNRHNRRIFFCVSKFQLRGRKICRRDKSCHINPSSSFFWFALHEKYSNAFLTVTIFFFMGAPFNYVRLGRPSFLNWRIFYLCDARNASRNDAKEGKTHLFVDRPTLYWSKFVKQTWEILFQFPVRWWMLKLSWIRYPPVNIYTETRKTHTEMKFPERVSIPLTIKQRSKKSQQSPCRGFPRNK